MSLFLNKSLPVKSTPPSPPLFHQENATEKYQFNKRNGNIYVHLCVPLFHLSVSWFSEMQFGVIYLETWGSTQPYVALSTLEFRSCFFVFGGTHTAVNSFTLHKPIAESLIVIQASALPGVLHVIAVTGNGLNC
jgi:hypothetical protein